MTIRTYAIAQSRRHTFILSPLHAVVSYNRFHPNVCEPPANATLYIKEVP